MGSSETLDFKKAEIVTKILSSLEDKEKASIGSQVNDLLFHCRYNGRRCNISTYDNCLFHLIIHLILSVMIYAQNYITLHENICKILVAATFNK